MIQRSFGNGLSVSVLGMGGGRVGSISHPAPVREIEATLETTIEAGINFFDTADIYGQGDSERTLARLLHRHGARMSCDQGRRSPQPLCLCAAARQAAVDSNDLVLDRIERYSKPTDAWRTWRSRRPGSPDGTVIHGAVCTEVLTDVDGTRVAALELRTVARKHHNVISETIVLSCGGLETPRLLLASRPTHSHGLGNAKDLVARFYMTHVVSTAENAGSLRFAEAATARAFDFNKTTDGISSRRMILLSPEMRRRGGLPNIVFRPGRPPIDDAAHRDAVLSAMFLVRSALIPQEYTRSLIAKPEGFLASRTAREHIGNTAAHIPALVRYRSKWAARRILAERKLPSVFLFRPDH